MRRLWFAQCLILFACLSITSACSRQEEQMPGSMPAPSQKQSQTAPTTTAPGTTTVPQTAAAPSQLNKAMSIHAGFLESFTQSLRQGDKADALRERIAMAEKARMDGMLLRSDLQDPKAVQFLITFSDKLQRYIDLAGTHIATLEEIDRLKTAIKEAEQNLAKAPEKDKASEALKLNALIDQHNALAENALAKERDELKALADELKKTEG